MENNELNNNIISKLLTNVFIDFENRDINTLKKYNLLLKLEKLDINTRNYKLINPDKYYGFNKSTPYNGFLVTLLSNSIYYCFYDNSFSNAYSSLKEIRKNHNIITFDIIDKLLELKENKITIKQLGEYIQTINK